MELELAKGLAIIFMVFDHVYEAGVYSIKINNLFAEFFENLIDFLGGAPSAPLFMFCMGVGFAYSKANPTQYVKRTGVLFGLALLVNLFEQWVPMLFSDNVAEKFIENAPSILATDIYFFAVLAMLFIAFVKCFEVRLHIKICIIAIIAFGVINAILSATLLSTGNVWLDTLWGIFFRLNEWSYFPFFIWINFPLIGYIVAILYRNASNQKQLKLILVAVAILLIVASSIYMDYTGMVNSVKFASIGTDAYYYAMSIPNVLLSLGIVIIQIALCNLFVLMEPLNNLLKIFFYMSKNIRELYVAQWIFIGLATPIIAKVNNIYENMLISLIILGLSVLSIYWYNCIKERKALSNNIIPAKSKDN